MKLNSDALKRRIQWERIITNIDLEQMKRIEGGIYNLRAGAMFRPDYPKGEVGEQLTPFIGVESRLTLEANEIPPYELPNGKLGWGIQRGEYLLVQTIEEVACPTDIVPIILSKRTGIQNGLMLITAHTSPGFGGKMMFGLYSAFGRVNIEKGSAIAGVIFIQSMEETELYEGIYQGDVKDSGGEQRPL